MRLCGNILPSSQLMDLSTKSTTLKDRDFACDASQGEAASSSVTETPPNLAPSTKPSRRKAA